MRKIFGGALLFSVVGAIIFGGVLAWSSRNTTSTQSNNVGTASWTLNYYPNNATLGPNGANTLVGSGQIHNNGVFNLQLDTDAYGNGQFGKIYLLSTDNVACGATDTNFQGGISPAGADALATIPPSGDGGGFQAYMKVMENAAEACQNTAVSYTIEINARTTIS